MGKRQFRIGQKDLIQKASELEGQKAQVILHNNLVFTGLIQKITSSEVLVKDARFNLHRISAHDVLEVVYDQETLY